MTVSELPFLLFCQIYPPSLYQHYISLLQEYSRTEKSPLLARTWSYNSLDWHHAMRRMAERYVNMYRSTVNSQQNKVMIRFMHMIDDIGPFYLSWDAFLSTIEMLGSQEQVRKWTQLLYDFKALGCYAQTEVAHGSDVKSLMTTATYYPQSESFIINSPSVKAAKFWPGLLGHFSTHCVLQAQTIVKGKNIGVQTFVVPIRDKFLQPLSGVKVGDLGSKLGFIRVDNGYLLLTNVSVGRDSMLSRFVQVQKDGTVLGLQNKQAIKYGYGSMLNLRVKLAFNFAFMLACSCKYSKPEKPVQFKLVGRHLSMALGMMFANGRVRIMYEDYMKALKEQNFKRADKLLVITHILSATFKALFSWRMVEGQKQLTYSRADSLMLGNGLAFILYEHVPAVTYQGDNNVMLQQTAGYLLKYGVSSKSQNELIRGLSTQLSKECQQLKGILTLKLGEGVNPKKAWAQDLQCRLINLSVFWGWFKFLQFLEEAALELHAHPFKDVFTTIKAACTSQVYQRLIPLHQGSISQPKFEQLSDKQIRQILEVMEFNSWKQAGSYCQVSEEGRDLLSIPETKL